MTQWKGCIDCTHANESIYYDKYGDIQQYEKMTWSKPVIILAINDVQSSRVVFCSKPCAQNWIDSTELIIQEFNIDDFNKDVVHWFNGHQIGTDEINKIKKIGKSWE